VLLNSTPGFRLKQNGPDNLCKNENCIDFELAGVRSQARVGNRQTDFPDLALRDGEWQMMGGYSSPDGRFRASFAANERDVRRLRKYDHLLAERGSFVEISRENLASQ
jgi:hypothetical protein